MTTEIQNVASLFEVDITTNSLAQINSKLNLNLCDYLLIIQTRKNHVEEVSDDIS